MPMETPTVFPSCTKRETYGRIPSQSARLHKNEAHIAGLLSKDPEFRNTQSGEAVASLTVATKFKESTEYHRVTCWEQLVGKVCRETFGFAGRCDLETLLSVEEAARRVGDIQKWTIHMADPRQAAAHESGRAHDDSRVELAKVIQDGTKSPAPRRN
jgi:hypothetical protein